MTWHFWPGRFERKSAEGRRGNRYEKVQKGISPILTPDKNIYIDQNSDEKRPFRIDQSEALKKIFPDNDMLDHKTFYTSLNKSDKLPVLKKIQNFSKIFQTAWRTV